MTTRHTDYSTGQEYFWTRNQVTKIYQVIEKRYAGDAKIQYLLSTGKSIKGWFGDMETAAKEAIRRQQYIDSRN